MKKKLLYQVFAVIMMAAFLVTGCGQSGNDSKDSKSSQRSEEKASDKEKVDAPEIPELTFERAMDLTYAKEFDVYYYKDGYKLIDVHEDRQYLIVPEGKEAPEGLDEDIVVIKQPVQNIYMAATATMSLFDRLDALDTISFSGLEASGWYVENAKEAIESTMILHTPKVQEMIEELGIPVFVDYSSYEAHPLGRTEWIKLYGAMLNKEDLAESFFEDQAKVIEELKDFKNTEKTVAYFYMNSDGSVVVRKSDDYIPSMIEIAGGRYIFTDLKNADSNAPSVKLTMEEFYATAVDTDYLIYNGTIDGQVSSIADLESKSDLFAEFKAVKDGNVWYTGKNLYQATDTVGELIGDIHHMLTDGDESQMTFLEKMN